MLSEENDVTGGTFVKITRVDLSLLYSLYKSVIMFDHTFYCKSLEIGKQFFLRSNEVSEGSNPRETRSH